MSTYNYLHFLEIKPRQSHTSPARQTPSSSSVNMFLPQDKKERRDLSEMSKEISVIEQLIFWHAELLNFENWWNIFLDIALLPECQDKYQSLGSLIFNTDPLSVPTGKPTVAADRENVWGKSLKRKRWLWR